jgi:hypothetical protein
MMAMRARRAWLLLTIMDTASLLHAGPQSMHATGAREVCLVCDLFWQHCHTFLIINYHSIKKYLDCTEKVPTEFTDCIFEGRHERRYCTPFHSNIYLIVRWRSSAWVWRPSSRRACLGHPRRWGYKQIRRSVVARLCLCRSTGSKGADYKIVLLGRHDVGKTSLVERFTHDRFSESLSMVCCRRLPCFCVSHDRTPV